AFFDRVFKATYENVNAFARSLVKLASGDDAGLSDTQVWRWLDATLPIRDAQVTSLLDKAEHAMAVATTCALPPEIFTAASLDQVRAIVAQHLSEKGQRHASNAGSWVVEKDHLPSDGLDVCKTERKIVSELLSAATEARRNVVVTYAPFDSGI